MGSINFDNALLTNRSFNQFYHKFFEVFIATLSLTAGKGHVYPDIFVKQAYPFYCEDKDEIGSILCDWL